MTSCSSTHPEIHLTCDPNQDPSSHPPHVLSTHTGDYFRMFSFHKMLILMSFSYFMTHHYSLTYFVSCYYLLIQLIIMPSSTGMTLIYQNICLLVRFISYSLKYSCSEISLSTPPVTYHFLS